MTFGVRIGDGPQQARVGGVPVLLPLDLGRDVAGRRMPVALLAERTTAPERSTPSTRVSGAGAFGGSGWSTSGTAEREVVVGAANGAEEQQRQAEHCGAPPDRAPAGGQGLHIVW
ncbi:MULTISPECIES: hypothetical protein [unclassified Micromonospora]|uniref:hypothetical protein n=1 Tax=unclassified Micromonospora TaxID=2617518 RepID=UPI001C242560|nr:hypothetical protein [Micromonospora sp. WMMB482]MBU8855724.1 hypothetical protein [Micromonospora sp. WMMB482]